jgi:hypothetical protein
MNGKTFEIILVKDYGVKQVTCSWYKIYNLAQIKICWLKDRSADLKAERSFYIPGYISLFHSSFGQRSSITSCNLRKPSQRLMDGLKATSTAI